MKNINIHEYVQQLYSQPPKPGETESSQIGQVIKQIVICQYSRIIPVIKRNKLDVDIYNLDESQKHYEKLYKKGFNLKKCKLNDLLEKKKKLQSKRTDCLFLKASAQLTTNITDIERINK